MAVRIAQSIGLHVEEDHRSPQVNDGVATQETRRRVWYSIYILDRLLALQLGRPPAITDDGFNIRLPYGVSDLEVCHQSNLQDGQSSTLREDSEGNYFIEMIKFSGIIGRVFNNLYGPNKAASASLTLAAIDSLDRELQSWKMNLPRNLRFDLSHTFESSIAFKRQACYESWMLMRSC